jgi:hypothetical protein
MLNAGPETEPVLDGLQDGFFAGTMFWASCDTFDTMFRRNFSLLAYDIERPQRNGTFPRALERLFSLLRVLEERVLYEISSAGLRGVDVTGGAVPWQSEVRAVETSKGGGQP